MFFDKKAISSATKCKPESCIYLQHVFTRTQFVKIEAQKKAIAAFRTALEFDPETPNGAYNIGLIYKDRKNWGIAAQWFEVALAVKPDDADARYWLDQMHAQLTGQDDSTEDNS